MSWTHILVIDVGYEDMIIETKLIA